MKVSQLADIIGTTTRKMPPLFLPPGWEVMQIPPDYVRIIEQGASMLCLPAPCHDWIIA